MKLKQYLWIFYWASAAILVAFGITTVIEDSIVFYAFGSLFIIFGLFRVVPLVKTTESKLIRWLTVAEILIEILAGLALFVFKEDMDGKNLFGYIIGGVLYLRGFMHFLATSFKSEPSTLLNFFVNIALLTVSTVIISSGGFNELYLAIFFLIVLVICAALLIWRGAKDYRTYRGTLVSNAKTKKITKRVSIEAETNPTSDEIKINIVPEEKEDDRPSIDAN